MFYVLQNESTAALRRVPILLTDAATGTTAMTGVATTNIYAYVNNNSGAFIGGTGSVGEAGFGQYYYQFDINEVSTLGLAGIHITAAGCRDYDAIAQIAAFNVYSPSAGGGATAGDVWSYVLSNASTADANLVAASAGGGATAFAIAQSVWDYDPSLYIGSSSGEYLAQTRTNTYTIDGNTTDIGNIVWNRDPTSVGDPLSGNFYSSYLYQLGTGTTGYPSGGGGGISAYDVWSFDYLAPGVVPNSAAERLEDTRTNTYNIDNNTIDIGNTVWNRNPVSVGDPLSGDFYSAYVYNLGTGSTGYPSGGGGGISAFDVWNYNLLSSGQSADLTLGNADQQATTAATNTNSPTLEANIWSYATRTITGGLADTVTTLTNKAGFAITGGTIDVVNDKTGYSLSGTQSFNLTGNITGNLSGSVGSVSGNVGGNVVGSVASVTNPVTLTNASYASIASSVWNSLTASFSTNGTFGKNILRADVANKTGDVTLYSSGGVNGVDADVHRIANDTAAATSLKNILTGIAGETLTANITGNVSGSVNSVTQPVSLSTATQASIANSVWLTDVSSYVAPSAGEDLATAAVGGISPADVWTYASRTITGGIADTVTTATNATNVTNPVSVSTTSMTGIANSTWSYGSRTLTSAAGATAGDVWSYATRTLTSGAGITVIGAVQLVNGPYRLTSNQNNNDGILDILQNSVQEINLNLIDGNGAPASTAGYGVAVNFFDEAGTAVTSYSPTVEYADGGILTFEIDTAVTATTGRYNLIVNLSGAGFLVKYGPLTTLVRPL